MTAPARRTQVLTAAIALAASLTVTTAAQAAPAGEDALQLSWDGHTYTATTAQSFLGDPVLVPGDSAGRTLQVRNDGPTSGTLRASIVNVQLLDPDASDTHHNSSHRRPGPDSDDNSYAGAGDQGSFYEDLAVSWDGGAASMAELHANGHTQILQIGLDQGEQVPITLAYELGHQVTSGNQANVQPRLASFDVLLEIGGDLPDQTPDQTPDPAPTPGTTPTPGTAPTPGIAPTPDTAPAPGTVSTGQSGAGAPAAESAFRPALSVTGTQGTVLLILAALALGTGMALRAARRAPHHGS